MKYTKYYVDRNALETRFLEEEEIKRLYTKIDLNNDSAEASGIPIVCNIEEKYMCIDNSDTNTIVVSSTGTGKSRRILMPELISIAKEGKSSAVIHDPKAELYKNTSGYFKECGYKVVVLNFRSPMMGARYNPLQYIAELYQSGKKPMAIEMFQSFANTMFSTVKDDSDRFWDISAGRYFVGLAIIACNIYDARDVTLYNIFQLHVYGNEKFGSGTFLSEICTMNGIDKMAYKFASTAIEASNETRSSIYAVFTSVMSAYVMNMDVVDMTSRSTFDVTDLIKGKVAVFLITRDETAIFDTLVASIIDQFYQILVDKSLNFDGVLPNRVEFILDEMSNMSKINEIERKISASRSRNIRWTLCVQSLEQLSVIYGKQIAKVIIGNCNNIMYLYSPDLELLKLLSDRCGRIVNDSTSQYEPLVSVERLQHLNIGECLMLLGRNMPFVTTLPDISLYPAVGCKSMSMKKRKRNEIITKDIKEIVKQEKKKKLEEIMAKDNESVNRVLNKKELDRICEKIKETEN